MRAARMLLGVGLVVGLCLMWGGRGALLDAYAVRDEPSTGIKLSGIDLTVEPTPIGPSPFRVDDAPDTRHHQITFTPGDLGLLPDPDLKIDPDTEPEIALGPGSAALGGVVVGLDGEPVPQATVRVERHGDGSTGEAAASGEPAVVSAGAVDDAVTSREVTADGDGQWSLDGIPGGRYRVRAWRSETYAAVSSEVLFVGDGESIELDLPVEPVAGGLAFDVDLDAAAGVPFGEPSTVAIIVSNETVDGDGHRMTGPVGDLKLSLTAPSHAVLTPESVVTNADGVARLTVVCQGPGRVTVLARASSELGQLTLPACLPFRQGGTPGAGAGAGVLGGGDGQ